NWYLQYLLSDLGLIATPEPRVRHVHRRTIRTDRLRPARDDGGHHGGNRPGRGDSAGPCPFLLRQGPPRCGAQPDLRRAHNRLGATPRAPGRLLVLGRADDRALPRPPSAGTYAVADRWSAFPALAGTVPRN